MGLLIYFGFCLFVVGVTALSAYLFSTILQLLGPALFVAVSVCVLAFLILHFVFGKFRWLDKWVKSNPLGKTFRRRYQGWIILALWFSGGMFLLFFIQAISYLAGWG